MTLVRQPWWFGLVLAPTALFAFGCREGTPPPAHNRNLGDEDVMLLPVRSTRLDPSLQDGSAQWHDFREFNAEEEAAGAEQPGEGGGEIETEIRELIGDFNEVVAERDVEGMLEYHLDGQQDTVEAWYEAKFAAMDKLAEVKGAFEEKLPDATERVAGTFAALENATGAQLVVESLTVVNENEVTGSLPAGAAIPTCRFAVIDEEWFIEFPQLPDFAQLKPALDDVTAACEGWLEALQSGERPAGEILDEVEAFVETTTSAGDSSEEDLTADEADPTGTIEDGG